VICYGLSLSNDVHSLYLSDIRNRLLVQCHPFQCGTGHMAKLRVYENMSVIISQVLVGKTSCNCFLQILGISDNFLKPNLVQRQSPLKM